MKPFLKQISISFVMTYLFLNYCKCKNENNLRIIPIGTRKKFLKNKPIFQLLLLIICLNKK